MTIIFNSGNFIIEQHAVAIGIGSTQTFFSANSNGARYAGHAIVCNSVAALNNEMDVALRQSLPSLKTIRYGDTPTQFQVLIRAGAAATTDYTVMLFLIR